MNAGILYVAIGKTYVEEAILSVNSLKRFNDLPIALVTDQEGVGDPFTIVNRVESTDNPHLAKAVAVASIPFGRTMFLDTDTRVLGSLDDAFAILDRFDLGLVADTYLTSLDEITMAFPAFNSGMIVYRRRQAVKDLFSRWVEYVKQGRYEWQCDQPALRMALWKEERVHVATLPNNFNFRCDYPMLTKGLVIVLHGRHHNLVDVEWEVNKNRRLRLWSPREMKIIRAR